MYHLQDIFVIRKCLFPAAGYDTRFLPATKSLPKEMLPIVSKPLIQYAVEERRRVTPDCSTWRLLPGVASVRWKINNFDVQLDQRSQVIDGFSEVDRLGVQIDFLDFGVGSHHAG